MNSARRATELALILIKAAPLRGTAARRQRLGLYDGTPGRTPGRNLAHWSRWLKQAAARYSAGPSSLLPIVQLAVTASRALRRADPSCTRFRASGPTCHPLSCRSTIRALPHATEMAQPAVEDWPEPKHSSWRVWIPVTLISTVFGLRALTVKVLRLCPSPTSITPASNCGGNLAPSPIVAWNRRALCSSLYAGKAVGSPTLQ